MAFATKAEICDPQAGEAFVLTAQKTMYGGKHIGEGDLVFRVRERERGWERPSSRAAVVTCAEAIAKKHGIARQTPRV